jgi:hypothetical protein
MDSLISKKSIYPQIQLLSEKEGPILTKKSILRINILSAKRINMIA